MADPVKVLYVEDEPAIAELLKSGLALFGMDVSPIYGNAEDAFNQVLAGIEPMASCKVLVFDIRLPGMTGLDLAQKLRDAGEDRPILIVSAYHPPPPSRMKELNARFMPKPFDFGGIVTAIQQMLE